MCNCIILCNITIYARLKCVWIRQYFRKENILASGSVKDKLYVLAGLVWRFCGTIRQQCGHDVNKSGDGGWGWGVIGNKTKYVSAAGVKVHASEKRLHDHTSTPEPASITQPLLMAPLSLLAKKASANTDIHDS